MWKDAILSALAALLALVAWGALAVFVTMADAAQPECSPGKVLITPYLCADPSDLSVTSDRGARVDVRSDALMNSLTKQLSPEALEQIRQLFREECPR